MIREWIEHLLLPQSAGARTQGYGKEIIAIQARYRRNAKAWASHLERSRTFIIETAMACPAKDACTVLGSGALLDVPLAELAGEFKQVTLVDMVHPRSSRRAVESYPNITLAEANLLDPAPWPGADADLVISLNVLSQLPLVPLKRGTAEGGGDARAIITDHLDRLTALPGQACLITDSRKNWRDLSGKLIPEENSLWGMELPEPDDSWTWGIAPAPELIRDQSLTLTVQAYADLSRKWTIAAP